MNEARRLGADVLGLALGYEAMHGRALPDPTNAQRGEELLAPEPLARIKILISQQLAASGLSKREFARRLGKAPIEVDRILDPIHGTTINTLSGALAVLGKELVIDLHDAA